MSMAAEAYSRVSIDEFCAQIRRADMLVAQFGDLRKRLASSKLVDIEDMAELDRALALFDETKGTWPLSDFGPMVALLESPIGPGQTIVAELTIPTDRPVLIARVRAPQLTISVYQPPGNYKLAAMSMRDEAPGLWLPVRPRESLRLDLKNDLRSPVDAHLSIEGYVLT
jgi:hypothetical protein